VLQQGANTVDVYLPAATWHSLTDGGWTLGPTVKHMVVALTDAPPVFVRGGSIVALQEPLNTTGESGLVAGSLVLGYGYPCGSIVAVR
jgi:alpha-glucosidase (family GH31 glycosyl hydrolase)